MNTNLISFPCTTLAVVSPLTQSIPVLFQNYLDFRADSLYDDIMNKQIKKQSAALQKRENLIRQIVMKHRNGIGRVRTPVSIFKDVLGFAPLKRVRFRPDSDESKFTAEYLDPTAKEIIDYGVEMAFS